MATLGIILHQTKVNMCPPNQTRQLIKTVKTKLPNVKNSLIPESALEASNLLAKESYIFKEVSRHSFKEVSSHSLKEVSNYVRIVPTPGPRINSAKAATNLKEEATRFEKC